MIEDEVGKGSTDVRDVPKDEEPPKGDMPVSLE
jgi:hypothetical protein